MVDVRLLIINNHFGSPSSGATVTPQHQRSLRLARQRSGDPLIVDDYFGSAAGRAAAPLIIDGHFPGISSQRR